MKTLDRIRARTHVAFVDDERNIGNPIIVTLTDGFDFAVDPGCGVRGFDTVAEAEQGTRSTAVVAKVQS